MYQKTLTTLTLSALYMLAPVLQESLGVSLVFSLPLECKG